MVIGAETDVPDGLSEERGAGTDLDERQGHFLVRIGSGGAMGMMSLQSSRECLELGVVTDHADAVLGIEAVVRRGDADADVAAMDGDDMDAVFLAETEFHQRFTGERRIARQVEVGEVEVLGQQTAFNGRALGRGRFGLLLPGAHIGVERLLDALGLAVEEAVRQDEGDQRQGQHRNQEDGEMEEMSEHGNDEAQSDKDADDDRSHQRRPVDAVLMPEAHERQRAEAMDHHGPEERGDQQNHRRGGQEAPPDAGDVQDQRHEETVAQGQDGDDEDQVHHRRLGDVDEVFLPVAAVAADHGGTGVVAVEEGLDPLRELSVQPGIDRVREADHVRGQEDGDYGHRHHDRVEEVARDAETDAQRGDDEGEFADLRQGEAALEGRLQRLSAQQDAEGREGRLADEDRQGDDENRKPVGADHGGIDHHADGDEEDGAEEVLDRLDEMVNVLCLHRFRQDGTHDESAERGGESRLGGDDHHAEAQTEGDHQQRLVVHQFPGVLEDQRDQEQAHHEPQHEEEGELEDAPEHLPALDAVGDGHGRQEDHEHDGKDVLQDQDAEHQTGEFLVPQPEILEGLVDDGRR